MAVVEVILAGPTAVELEEAHPKVELVERGGDLRVEFPFAPKIEKGGLGRLFEAQERVGRKPRLARGAQDLISQSFEALFALQDHQDPVEGPLRRLERMAARDKPVRWRNFGPGEAGWFRIASLSITDELRQHGTNLQTRAVASFTLLEDSEIGDNPGPATGGVKPKAKGKAAEADQDAKGSKAKGWPKTYVVKAGDTLSGIAAKVYDDASEWRRIADKNGIRDPRKLRVGQKLKLPAPA